MQLEARYLQLLPPNESNTERLHSTLNQLVHVYETFADKTKPDSFLSFDGQVCEIPTTY